MIAPANDLPAEPAVSTPGPLVALWGTLRSVFQQLRYAEPAVLKARWTMALGTAAAMGLTIPGVIDRWAGVVLAAFTVLAPWLQGKRTRADVWSQQTVDDLTELAALFPGLADEAKRLLGAGLSYRIVRGHLEGQTLAGERHS